MARQEDPRDDGMNEEVVWPPKDAPTEEPPPGGETNTDDTGGVIPEGGPGKRPPNQP